MDGGVEIWDITTLQPLNVWYDHTDIVRSVVFSPDGNLLASGSSDNTINLWDVQAGIKRGSFLGPSEVWDIKFSPDGKMLAYAVTWTFSGTGSIFLLDTETGIETTLLDFLAFGITSLCFSPDGALLASGSSDSAVRLWDVTKGLQLAVLPGHTDSVLNVTFNPDGALLASGSLDGTVRIWDVEYGAEKAVLGRHSSGVRGLVFSPDGTQLASGGLEGDIILWGYGDRQALSSVSPVEDTLPSDTPTSDTSVKQHATPAQDTNLYLFDAAVEGDLQ
jgi:WD40 repeat protein